MCVCVLSREWGGLRFSSYMRGVCAGVCVRPVARMGGASLLFLHEGCVCGCVFYPEDGGVPASLLRRTHRRSTHRSNRHRNTQRAQGQKCICAQGHRPSYMRDGGLGRTACSSRVCVRACVCVLSREWGGLRFSSYLWVRAFRIYEGRWPWGAPRALPGALWPCVLLLRFLHEGCVRVCASRRENGRGSDSVLT